MRSVVRVASTVRHLIQQVQFVISLMVFLFQVLRQRRLNVLIVALSDRVVLEEFVTHSINMSAILQVGCSNKMSLVRREIVVLKNCIVVLVAHQMKMVNQKFVKIILVPLSVIVLVVFSKVMALRVKQQIAAQPRQIHQIKKDSLLQKLYLDNLNKESVL